MADHNWFDDDIGERLPENTRRFPCLPSVERLPDEQDLEKITLALQILVEEREQRPQLVTMLEEYPLLLAEYLTLPKDSKMALEQFRRRYNDYFYDQSWNGDCIRHLTRRREENQRAAAMVARKYRWAEQLKKLFAFYLQYHKETHAFNNNYLRKNPGLRRAFRSLGATLVQNLYQNDMEVKDIVAIIVSAQPEIHHYYQEPGYRSNAVSFPKRRG